MTRSAPTAPNKILSKLAKLLLLWRGIFKLALNLTYRHLLLRQLNQSEPLLPFSNQPLQS